MLLYILVNKKKKLFKIGYTRNLSKRLIALKSCGPFDLSESYIVNASDEKILKIESKLKYILSGFEYDLLSINCYPTEIFKIEVLDFCLVSIFKLNENRYRNSLRVYKRIDLTKLRNIGRDKQVFLKETVPFDYFEKLLILSFNLSGYGIRYYKECINIIIHRRKLINELKSERRKCERFKKKQELGTLEIKIIYELRRKFLIYSELYIIMKRFNINSNKLKVIKNLIKRIEVKNNFVYPVPKRNEIIKSKFSDFLSVFSWLFFTEEQ